MKSMLVIIGVNGIRSLSFVGERLMWEEVDEVVDLSISLEQSVSRADKMNEDESSSKCACHVTAEGIDKEVSDTEVRLIWTWWIYSFQTIDSWCISESSKVSSGKHIRSIVYIMA